MPKRIRPDEDVPVGASVLWYGYPSPWYFFGSICFGLTLLPLGVGLLLLLRAYVRRNSFQYVIAENKVAIEYGYWVKSSRELRVADIRSINILRHGISGLFGLGSVEFSSAAHVGANVVFGGVSGAEAVADVVRALQDGKEPLFVPKSRMHSMVGVFAVALLLTACVDSGFYWALRSLPKPPSHYPRSDYRPEHSLNTPADSDETEPSTPRQPVRTPVYVAPTPYTPAPPAFAADVKQSQFLAIQKHPDLAIKDSPANRRFLARYQEWKDRHDPRLDRSDWPQRLADETAVP